MGNEPNTIINNLYERVSFVFGMHFAGSIEVEQSRDILLVDMFNRYIPHDPLLNMFLFDFSIN